MTPKANRHALVFLEIDKENEFSLASAREL